MNFTVLKSDTKSKARRGRLQLKNAVVETPIFMPVGTYGNVRGLSVEELEAAGASIMLNNCFHMVCRPGVEIIKEAGGLHSFNSWSRAILTDSGGFQVFSLAEHRKIEEQGVQFKDPFSGEPHLFTPESVVEAQEIFGSDVMMVLDECPNANADLKVIQAAVERTTRWAERSKRRHSNKELALFPIFQGACDLELRKKSLKGILALESDGEPWQGIAIGGLSVGESKEDFVKTLYGIREFLPSEKPRYLMGVGSPRDLVFAVCCGVDMFDCVIPSRNARHGIIMTSEGRINILNSEFRNDHRPLDEKSSSPLSRKYSRSFLRHLFQVKESLGPRIATIQNIHFYVDLMAELRRRLEDGSFYEFAWEFLRDPKTLYLGRDQELKAYPEAY